MKKSYGFSGLLCAAALSLPAHAADTKPLLQEGKHTLFQRVLTYPGCMLAAKAGEAGKEQPAFSRFYVYQREKQGQDEWLQVGPDSFGHVSGWMKSSCTVDWKVQLTLAFTNPAGRHPMLFFKEKGDVESLLNNAKPAAALEPMIASLNQKKPVPQVLAREPDYMVDQLKNFYLLPVLGSDDIFTDTGFQVRVLNVASVSENGSATTSAKATDEKNMMKGFSASVVFVIDSTISMGPYIDRTKEAIDKIYKQIEKEQLQDKVKFGLVAYRSSVKAVPGLEYDAKMYVDPNTVKDGKDFLAKVHDLKQATVSSSKVDEDAYAGVMTALDKVDWTQFGARYVVLITDAGALDGTDSLSSTHLGAEQVRQEAAYRGVALYLSLIHI